MIPNGSLPEREVHAGVCAVRVKVPRVRDRSGTGLRFHSALLPPYLRRSQSLGALCPGSPCRGVLDQGIFGKEDGPRSWHRAPLCPLA